MAGILTLYPELSSPSTRGSSLYNPDILVTCPFCTFGLLAAVLGSPPYPPSPPPTWFRPEVSASGYTPRIRNQLSPPLHLEEVMAFFLFQFLNIIFRPLRQISSASTKIAKGNYGSRLSVQGKDEVASVAYNQWWTPSPTPTDFIDGKTQRWCVRIDPKCLVFIKIWKPKSKPSERFTSERCWEGTPVQGLTQNCSLSVSCCGRGLTEGFIELSTRWNK